ncbi:MAG: hypothetical protein V4787_19570 [Pseudomonadota bacterium]
MNRTEEIIASGTRLIEQAQLTLKRADQFFKAQGIDPRESAELMRREQNNPQVQALQAEFRAAMKRIEADAAQSVAKPASPSRRPRRFSKI